MPPAKKSGPATQSDLANVKSELMESIKRVAVEVVRTNSRIDDFRTEMNQNNDRVMTVLDRIVKLSEADNRAMKLHDHAILEHQDRLEDHEARITALEPKP